MVTITAMPGTVTTKSRLNVRKGTPSTKAPIAGKLEAGVTVAVRGTADGDNVEGIPEWYAGNDDTFFWAGGCAALQPAVAQVQGSVHRRPNGTIMTLSDAEIRNVFGTFTYTETNPKGAIRIDAAWEAAHIVPLATPIFARFGHASIRCHKKAHDPLQRVFTAIANAGMEDHILAYDGCHVPRHKGWNPSRGLSAHSWGIAVDINARWNGYGAGPAPAGAYGSTRELISFFEAEGFAWGGYFTPDNIRDGMHFELARYDL